MQFTSLTHNHAEYITWSCDELQFTLLGGIRIEGLHAMRVTLKIDFKGFPSIRHGVDLYNETQSQKLIRSITERFSLSTEYVEKVIGNLVNTVEDYRLEQMEAGRQQGKAAPTLTPEQRKAAESFLKQPGLLQRTNEVVGCSGVIGEDTNRLIMYLVFTSRKTNRPLHIISMGSSGTGKSHLQESIAELIPEEDKIELTSISGNAFYYYVDDDLGHKLILIEDYDGVFAALYPIRELQSKQRISKTITNRDRNGHTRTLHLKVKGPVSISGCTTSEHIYEDNANRSFLIYLDESEAQDERIMTYQRKLSAGTINTTAQQQARQQLQNVQRLLQPISVRNPYAESLVIPASVFKPRRTNAHYIAFIEAITFYKQYQRAHKTDQSSGEIYIETSLEDIAEANELIKDILLKKSDPLGYATRGYFERLKAWLQDKEQKTFTNQEARDILREHPSKQKRCMVELQQYGLIKRVEGDQKNGYVYELTRETEYKEMASNISHALDKALQDLSSTPADQNNTEPLKSAPVKRKAK